MNLPDDARTATDGSAPPLFDGDLEVAPEAAGLAKPRLLGHFEVLGKLGEGGMGVVYAGYDPELDRRVALKLVSARGSREGKAQERLLREAQAIARLSHPNVVQVYDVGKHEGLVFLALEFVEGHTLRAWRSAGARSWREVRDVYVQAGRGLAAAHAVGLVHRDFKPDNALIGADGRVRVMDFGLAREHEEELADETATSVRMSMPELTRAGAVVGTPAYMAPEQLMRGPIDARADQFSFCVALYEALLGQRPFVGETTEDLRRSLLLGPPSPFRTALAPRWLQAVLLRGLASDPDARFPSMEALLRALTRDPWAAPRRWAAAGGIGLAGVGLWLGLSGPPAEVCTGAREQLAPVWDARREEVASALLATDVPFAADTWARVEARLDRFAAGWGVSRDDACAAHRREEQSDAVFDLRVACLDRGRVEFAALIDQLARADADTTRVAMAALDGLPDIRRCNDVSALTASVAPPDPSQAAQVDALRERLAAARAAAWTRKNGEATAITHDLLKNARQLGYRPLIAEAQVVRGDLANANGEAEAARDSYTEAIWLADMIRDDVLLADTQAKLLFVLLDRLGAKDEAERWRPHIEAVSYRLGADSPSRATLLWALGFLSLSHGRHAEAKELLLQSLALGERVLDADDLRRGQPLGGLVRVAFERGALDEARQWAERTLEFGERVYGPDHPELASLVMNLGSTLAALGDLEGALPQFERAKQIVEAAQGDDHIRLAPILDNLGAVYAQRGELTRAREALTRSLALTERAVGKDHPRLAAPLYNLGLLLLEAGDLAASRTHLDRALAIRERALPPGDADIARSLESLGKLDLEAGDLPRAIAQLERALEMLRPIDEGTSVASTQFTLAKALRAAGEHARADALAAEAAQVYRTVPGGKFEEELATIEAWRRHP